MRSSTLLTLQNAHTSKSPTSHVRAFYHCVSPSAFAAPGALCRCCCVVDAPSRVIHGICWAQRVLYTNVQRERLCIERWVREREWERDCDIVGAVPKFEWTVELW